MNTRKTNALMKNSFPNLAIVAIFLIVLSGCATYQSNVGPTQIEHAYIEATAGEKILLRLNNVSVDRFYTITAQGLTMQVVGTGARLARGIDGKNIYLETASVNTGGGETKDILIDTAGVAPGTYFLYATELHQMSNLTELDGGMITEIVIN